MNRALTLCEDRMTFLSSRISMTRQFGSSR